MELVCPHCQNALDPGEHPPTEEILCPVCGSSFRLEPLATTDYRGRDDRRRLGKYELIDTVGAGAFGTVYMRGYAVVGEPGRRIVARELEGRGLALPWVDGVAFARQAIELSLVDRAVAERRPGRVFFDRGLIDATSALQHLTGEPAIAELRHAHRYNRHVFLTPPWPEIYRTDQERQHGFAEAVAEYDRLCEVYPSFGYQINILPKIDVEVRADLILATLQAE